MRILIIGGTRFLGRTIADFALTRGHTLTLFHRGISNPSLYPEAEHIIGDRNGSLDAISRRAWDAVIDPSAYFPRQVRSLLQALDGASSHYTFISSISAYRDTRIPGVDEQYPTGKISDPALEEITAESYGPLKALCEAEAFALLPGCVLDIRPGLIVGPHDPTDRFTYWPVRIANGGQVIAPGRPERSVQFIDVRDLAEWILNLVENGQTGVFNATGLPQALSMDVFLETCGRESLSTASLIWAADEFLLENNVEPWIEMPLWIPDSDSDAPGFFSVSVQKAVSTGLTFRPLSDTVRAVLEWARTRPPDYSWRAGLSADRETMLVQKLADRDLTPGVSS